MNMTKPTKTFFSTIAVCIVIAFASVASVNASDNDVALDAPKEHKGHQHQENKHKGHQHQENKHKGHKQKMKRMDKALSLSEEQQVQIKAIKTQAKEQHQILQASMQEFKIEEKKLLQTEKFDEQAFNTLHDTYQPIFKQLALIRVKDKHAIFNVLTTEQQEKWLKMIDHKKGQTKKRRG